MRWPQRAVVAAILAVDGVPRELDEEILIAHFVHYHRPGVSRSFFRGIDKLPATRLPSVFRRAE